MANVYGTNNNDNLVGTAGNDIMWGYGGDDILNGMGGADTMQGGTGNDTYYVDNAGDVVIEYAGEGIDTVFSSVSYTLGANVERMVLTGADAINGTGNDLDNTFYGNGAYSISNTGANQFTGGLGNDTYYLGVGDTVVESAGEGIDTVVAGFIAGGFTSYTLGANVENLNLSHRTANVTAIGNELNNVIAANGNYSSTGGNDVVDGGLGADTMSARGGNDTYYVDNAGDVVNEYAGEGNTDLVISSVSYTLGANVENMTLVGTGLTATGNNLNNTYNINNAGNSVIEGINGGTDTIMSSVSYTLDANVENLTLVGTNAINGIGNELDNSIYTQSNTVENVLTGGLGNDYYNLYEGDTVVEYAGEGVDTITVHNLAPTLPFNQESVNYTLSANVENLTLAVYLVNGFSYKAYGVGNSLDNFISVQGSTNDDVLDGGAGADTMSAELGNDTYYVDNAGDVVIENAGGETGNDTVFSTVSYTLGANVENITLSGTLDINATGNALNNAIKGNTANNVLNGGGGSDVLTGYAGSDIFVFNTAPGASNVDTITDFTSGSDSMQLALAMFSGIGATGALSATAFVSGAGVTAATTAEEHIAYNTSTGMLYYDADGAGGNASIAFATLNGTPALTANDFAVV